MNPIIQFIIDTLITKFQVSPEGLTADSMFESMEIDSLVLIELGVILGNQFDVEIDGGDLMTERSIRRAAALIEARSTRSERRAV
jgi:acyl carrier protein